MNLHMDKSASINFNFNQVINSGNNLSGILSNVTRKILNKFINQVLEV
jgi:hypothetical protein